MNLRKLSAEAATDIFGSSLFKYCFVWVPNGTPTKQVRATIKRKYPHLVIGSDFYLGGKYLVLPVASVGRLYEVPTTAVARISPTYCSEYKDFFVVDDFCWTLYHKQLCT